MKIIGSNVTIAFEIKTAALTGSADTQHFESRLGVPN